MGRPPGCLRRCSSIYSSCDVLRPRQLPCVCDGIGGGGRGGSMGPAHVVWLQHCLLLSLPKQLLPC